MLKEFSQIIKDIETSDNLYVGYSGGVDSTVLLYLLKKTSSKNIIAIHCNHGLSSKADAWQNHCDDFAKRIGVKLISVCLELNKSKNIELQARDMRRDVFAKIIPKGENLLLAHHLNDQVETILYRIFRGTGIHGASGIKKISEFRGINIHRPLLGFNKDEIEDFAKKNGLSWIEDDSNIDVNIDRNYIRNIILPAILNRWPKGASNIARFAKLCDEHVDGINESIKTFVAANYDGDNKVLNLNDFYDLEFKQQKEIIRYVIIRNIHVAPTLKQTEHIIKDVVMSKDDACPEFIFNGVILKKSQGYLYIYKHDQLEKIISKIDTKEKISISLGERKIINSYALTVTTNSIHDGSDLMVLYGRWGKTGKKVFQKYKIPVWLRNKYPLLYYKDKLIAILGLWVRAHTGFTVEYKRTF